MFTRWRPVFVPLAAAAIIAVALFTASELGRSIFDAGRETANRDVDPDQGGYMVTLPEADSLDDSLDVE
jgi:hypothetical protein